jgi:hypothetical protein
MHHVVLTLITEGKLFTVKTDDRLKNSKERVRLSISEGTSGDLEAPTTSNHSLFG